MITNTIMNFFVKKKLGFYMIRAQKILGYYWKYPLKLYCIGVLHSYSGIENSIT